MARLCFLEGKFKLKAIGDSHFTKRSVLKTELINCPNRFLKYRTVDLKYERDEQIFGNHTQHDKLVLYFVSSVELVVATLRSKQPVFLPFEAAKSPVKHKVST